MTIMFTFWFFSLWIVVPLLALWIALDEMREQHPIRRGIYLVFVPLCLFLAPITLAISLIPMCFLIALGEAFDKPKPVKETKIDILEKHVSNRILRDAIWLIIAVCLTILALYPLLISFLKSLL